MGPHPIALAAADALKVSLRSASPELGGEGKMFGVLVVRRGPELGFLRAFSGTARGRWRLPGFVPPVFDAGTREAVEGPGERLVTTLTERGRRYETSPEVVETLAHAEALGRAQRQALEACAARHREARTDRHLRRAALPSDASLNDEQRAGALHALDQESRRDKAELRRLRAQHAEETAELERALVRVKRRLGAHARLRAAVSRRLMQQIHDAYRIPNARGEVRALRALFPSGEPPSGAADCAGPKLLATAYSMGWIPVALAEFWWGPPPVSGGRLEGELYPACLEKCGPILPFMLEGLDVAPARRFVAPDVRREPLRIVYEDASVVVVDKPAGLLSVPGKDDVGDSVLERLRARHPDATGPLLVHRLDLDTSGLLVACLDARSHAFVQKQFAARTVEKRYVALLDGEVRGEGRVELALRVDLNDRPRQIHDPLHGKRAVTDWIALGCAEGRTRVALFPRTGRTHQLRVHAAHPLGIGVPMVGDRLYGRGGGRLMLHAEELAFIHPVTRERLVLRAPAPF